MISFRLLLLLLSVGALPARLPAQRAAWVVGNGNYTQANRLSNPVRDAQGVGTALAASGFTVTQHLDATGTTMERGLDAFIGQFPDGADCAVIFFAGHGLETDGENYLMPVDAALFEKADLRRETLPLSQVLTKLDASAFRLKIVILDCCRQDPFAATEARAWMTKRSGGGGLVPVDSRNLPSSTMVLFAGAPGGLVSDGLPASHSPFTQGLLRRLATGAGVPVLDLFLGLVDSIEGPDHPWLRMHEAMESLERFRRFPLLPSVFVNSLGMEFVPVPGTKILCARRETRVADFGRFVESDPTYRYEEGEKPHVLSKTGWIQEEGPDRSWVRPGFPQSDQSPVVCVSWEDANAFCAWLSRQENRTYRLPTDAEWSVAAGTARFPWGEEWPPRPGAANLAGIEAADEDWPNTFPTIPDYHDNDPRTSPTGRYPANLLGIHDLGGNVREWCQDRYGIELNPPDLRPFATPGTDLPVRTVRGGSWAESPEWLLRADFRAPLPPETRLSRVGFRCVLEEDPAPTGRPSPTGQR